MSITIVTTVGDASANSYATLAEADAYFATRVPSDVWDALLGEEELRKKYLVAAAQEIDRLYARTFIGQKATETQARQWPRYWAQKVAPAYNETTYRTRNYRVYYESTDIPAELKQAQYEMAYALAEGWTQEQARNDIASFSADGQAFTFRDSIAGDGMPPRVVELLSGLVKRGRLRRA